MSRDDCGEIQNCRRPPLTPCPTPTSDTCSSRWKQALALTKECGTVRQLSYGTNIYVTGRPSEDKCAAKLWSTVKRKIHKLTVPIRNDKAPFGGDLSAKVILLDKKINQSIKKNAAETSSTTEADNIMGTNFSKLDSENAVNATLETEESIISEAYMKEIKSILRKDVCFEKVEDCPKSVMQSTSSLQELPFISTWTHFLALKSEVPTDARKTNHDTFCFRVCSSLSEHLDFDEWAFKHGFRFDEKPKAWVTTIWDAWFDEVRPIPEPAELVKRDEPGCLHKTPGTPILKARPCLREAEVNTKLTKTCKERFELEIGELNKVINENSGILKSIFLCRRAALSLKGLFEKGCILRRIEPWQSIQDFSTCLLLSNEPSLLKDVYTQRAITYYELKEYPPAIEDFQSALKIDPRDSVESFDKALTYAFDPPTVLLHRTFALSKAKKYEAAVKGMRNILDSGITDSYSSLLLGKYLFEFGDYKGARTAICSVSNVNFEHMVEDKKHHVLMLSFLGQHQQAATIFQSLCSNQPSTARLITLGKYQMKAKMHRQALRTFFSILNRSPEISPFRCIRIL
ncbi:Cytochrome c oxidase subunit 1 [Sparganum proliferum]